jgi:hypothetical protein
MRNKFPFALRCHMPIALGQIFYDAVTQQELDGSLS